MAKRRARNITSAKELDFDYIKSNQFRVIAMEGAYGGISPNGKQIHMAIFNERRPIPKKSVHKLTSEGLVGEEIAEKREVRSGVVREVEADIIMDLDTALTLQKWLGEKIEEYRKTEVARQAFFQKLQERSEENRKG